MTERNDDWEAFSEAPEGRWPSPLNLDDLAQLEPVQPRFIVDGWIPAGYGTQFAAHGGSGKSSIALHQAVCIATGKQWWGFETQQSRVIYLSCEDRVNVLHWRLKHACDFMGINMTDLNGRLELLDLVGHETIVWRPEKPFTTKAYHELANIVRPDDVIYVDGVSDTFGGNENARHEVKAFVNSLLGLIEPERGAVILIAHVNKATASSGASTEGYSGSTQWHNAVRARHYLYPEADDENERTGNLILELQKSNLGKSGQFLKMSWDDAAHMFVADAGTGGNWIDRQEQDARAEAVFLKLLDRRNKEGRPLSHLPTSPNNAPKAMSRMPGSEGLSKRQFDRAMESLFSAEKIRVEEYETEGRKRRAMLVRAE